MKNHPNVTVINEEVTEIPEGPTVIATGPLTSQSLSDSLKEIMDEEYFYFYDAAAPIVEKDSIDMDKVYLKSRYDKGEAAYLNCPMTEEEFDRFYDALIAAETVPLKEFEKEIFFEGCMPIEVMASTWEENDVIWSDEACGPRRSKNRENVLMLLFNCVRMMQQEHYTILLVFKHI